LTFSKHYNYLLSTISGDNSAAIFKVDKATGLLTPKMLLPVSGDYPKDAEFFPCGKFLVSLNHESNNMTFFKVNLEEGTLVMNGPAVHVDQPNCIRFYKLPAGK
jgi:6-phosphogluconolactonase